MGAMLGGAVRGAVGSAFPELEGEVGLYALVGMGTMFAGILRAPITSVFMILEVSGNYSIILPVMVSNAAAYLVSRSFTHESIFDMVGRQDGVLLPSMEQRREAVARRVEDALTHAPRVLAPEMSLQAARQVIQDAGGGPVLAHVRPGVWGAVPPGLVEQLASEGKEALAIGSVLGAVAPLPTLYPDESLEIALATIGDRPMVPVVHRADPDRLIGIVTTATVLAAFTRTQPKDDRGETIAPV
jgi:CIC family chloride channel protein